MANSQRGFIIVLTFLPLVLSLLFGLLGTSFLINKLIQIDHNCFVSLLKAGEIIVDIHSESEKTRIDSRNTPELSTRKTYDPKKITTLVNQLRTNLEVAKVELISLTRNLPNESLLPSTQLPLGAFTSNLQLAPNLNIIEREFLNRQNFYQPKNREIELKQRFQLFGRSFERTCQISIQKLEGKWISRLTAAKY